MKLSDAGDLFTTTACVFFALVLILGIFVLESYKPVVRPRFDQPIPRGECKCPGNYMCYSCPVDPVCRCEPTKADYERADEAYRQVQRDFAPVIQSLNPSQ